MSLKLVCGFLFFAVLACYLAFLNPQEINLRLTQYHSLKIPLVVLLLGAVVMGVAITALFNGLHEIRILPAKLSKAIGNKRRQRQRLRCENLYEEAENACVGGNFGKASALFQKILSMDPDHIPALCRVGDFMRSEGRFDQAIAMHGKARRLAPRNIKILYHLADDYAGAGQYDKEIQTLRQIGDHSIPSLHKLRDAWLKVQDWEKASAIQKEILRLTPFPESEKARSRLCEIIHMNARRRCEEGDTDSAIAELKRAIKEDKYSLPAYITLGDVYLETRRGKEALKVWKAGYDNTKSIACLRRIQSLSDGDFVKLCENTLTADSRELAAILGASLLEKGENEKAVQILEGSANNPSLPNHVLLAIARQARNGNGQLPDASRSIFNKVRQSLSLYTCGNCLSSLAEWSSHCPACKAWNSVLYRMHP